MTTSFRFLIVALVALASTALVKAFSPTINYIGNEQRRSIPHSESVGALRGFIKGEAKDSVPFDENKGGVGLAKRSAIKIRGISPKGKVGEAQELIRYDGATELDAVSAKSVLGKAGNVIICSGAGKELYQDPGSSTRYEDKVIKTSPTEAAKDALKTVSDSSLGGAKAIVVNFLGGNDLIMGEVLEACEMLVGSLNVPEKAKVTFNSICFTDFPSERCHVTVVSLLNGDSAGFEGSEKSLAKGEVYIQDETWWTVMEDQITTNEN